MIETKKTFSYSTVPIYDVIHASGGTRWSQRPTGWFALLRASGEPINFPEVRSQEQFGQFLRSHDLIPIGWEQIQMPQGILRSIWTLFEGGGHAADLWSGIAYAARKANQNEIAEDARNITFALRTSALRIRDVSNEYHHQNILASNGDAKLGKRFANIELFDLYMALHSLLVEMCSARDYLARFISTHIFRQDEATKMSELFRQVSSKKTKHALAEEIRIICDAKHPGAWMARLGRFRNLIVHEAPIATLGERFLTAKPLDLGTATVCSIHLGIPRDPIQSLDGERVDALANFHGLSRNLFQFAQRVADASCIRPERITITDADLI
jgi:hypothetical protein